MVRRIVLILSLSLVTLHGVAGANIVDGFSFLEEDPLFISFIAAVRVDGNREDAEGLRHLLYARDEDEPEATIKRIRIDTTLARLYVETENSDKERVQQLLGEAEQKLESLESNSFHALILASEIDGIWYLDNPRSVGKGMASSRKINKAFKEYPKSSHRVC